MSAEVSGESNLPSRGLFSWHPVVLFLAAAVTLFARFFRENPLGFFEDDFFYYAQVARNLALHGMSTFDGIHRTNGVHPLWMLILTLLYKLTPSHFLPAVQALSLGLIMVLYVAVLRCLERVDTSAAIVRPAALLLSLQALLLFRYGMEVTVALPLGFATLAHVLSKRFRWTPAQTFSYGLLASLTVLARLDEAIFFALLFTAQTLAGDAPWSTRLRRAGLFTLGFAPFFLYLAINLHIFHTLLPISGDAKQMKPLLPPSWTPLRSLLFPLDRMKTAFMLPSVALLAIGLVQFARVWFARAHTRPGIRPLLFACLGFPILQFGALSLLSDWPVWPWYFCSFLFSSFAAIALSLVPRPNAKHSLARLALGLTSALYLVYCGAYAVTRKPAPISFIAQDLAAFSLQHRASTPWATAPERPHIFRPSPSSSWKAS